MGILSASLPDDLLDEVDAAIASGAYKGRDRLQSSHAPTGRHVHGSITVLYPHATEARISEVRHAFHDVVLSLMHTHCEPETCMDVLLVGGAPQRVQDLAATLERMRDVRRSRIVIMA
jgi:metal-responsive CopG/Arc/MetJ family transcriptional regulator